MNEIKVAVTEITAREFEYTWATKDRRRGTMNPDRGKIYFFRDFGKDGYNPLLDIFTGERYNKPYKLFRKQVLPWLVELLGIDPEAKISWSKNAGCTMCPCSSGFIVHDPNFRKDVWVDYMYVEIPEIEEEVA